MAKIQRLLPLMIITAAHCGPALAAEHPSAAASPVAAAATPVVAGAPVQPTPVPAATAVPGGMVIPALTPVKLEIRKQLVSKISKPGESFPLRLAEPILINGVTAVPAGTEGMGEVVESKGGGMAGGAGILILAARYLNVDGRQLRLRSMHIAQAGTDNRAAVDTAMIAFGYFALPLMFVSGGKTGVPAGTIAEAKTADVFALAAPPAVASTTPQIATTSLSSPTQSGTVSPTPSPTHDKTPERITP